MKHTLAQLEAAIDAGQFRENDDWQLLCCGADILNAKSSAIIKLNDQQMRALAILMHVKSDGNYSLTFEHNGNTVIFQTTIL